MADSASPSSPPHCSHCSSLSTLLLHTPHSTLHTAPLNSCITISCQQPGSSSATPACVVPFYPRTALCRDWARLVCPRDHDGLGNIVSRHAASTTGLSHPLVHYSLQSHFTHIRASCPLHFSSNARISISAPSSSLPPFPHACTTTFSISPICVIFLSFLLS